ncbi:MAG: sigma-54-dependent Fis family transcriptional regulator [Bryobacterales bacterium]|nr:sigma-54-dependent Fis family transcriptional regulator [Bryobacterales bacterium]
MIPAGVDAPHCLVGQSPQIRKIRHLIDKFGRSATPVLLLGETGSGKEVVARAIHDAHPTGHFVPIDCGSLVGPLVESELFGHVKGAFTNAHENKRGLIELANGGTAFFDEIGDLPMEMQVKLLRVLQEREYRPVGSLSRHKVQIRVIAATHRDLPREIERGNFRQDLYYRLNVVTLRIPPLRERREDIPLLIDHFLDRLGARFVLTEEARRTMVNYEWPGNVRELWNCVQRMTAMAPGNVVQVADLPTGLQNHLNARHAGRVSMAAAMGGGGVPVSIPSNGARTPVFRLSEIERRTIIDALRHTRGDRTHAAQLLGIGRTTLYRKMKEYSIEQEHRMPLESQLG